MTNCECGAGILSTDPLGLSHINEYWLCEAKFISDPY